MKKLIASCMLVAFIFSVFYPAIYATENNITNEIQEEEKKQEEKENLEEIAENTVQEETRIEPEENIVIEENEKTKEENEVIESTEEVENSVVENVTDVENVENVTTIENKTTDFIEEKIEDKINVEVEANQTYTGKMNLESFPMITYKLPESNIMNVYGWAVSDDVGAYLILRIDGNQYACKNIVRNKRADVDQVVSPSFGGTSKTPKAGFSINVDISNVAEGMHDVEVCQVSRYHKVMNSAKLKLKVERANYTGKMNLESFPLLTYTVPNSNIMNVYGWAVSDDAGAYLILRIDGNQYACKSIVRNKRADVDRAVSLSFGGTAKTPKAGFSINVDISNVAEGMHNVEVCQVSRYHKVMNSAKLKLKVQTPTYTGLMNIEAPIRNKRYRSDWLEVKGWALTEANGDSIKIYLDGKYQATAQAIARPDVIGVHGAKYPKHSEYAGFISNINASGLAEGTHIVKIEHCSKYGKVIQTQEVPFMISNTQTWGIDVSHYQGTINWNSVRNQGINFAILKIGEYRESSGRIIVDSSFNQNYAMCKQLGIAVGGYFYSYAFDPNEASHEASACLQVIQGKSFEMPIFLDIEDDIIRNAVNSGRTSKDALTNGAVTFCQIMNQNGHKAGVYANKNFLTNYLNASVLEQYNIWLAHYVNVSDYSGKYDMWQYTSSGSVPGINGPVDLDWCFRRYY